MACFQETLGHDVDRIWKLAGVVFGVYRSFFIGRSTICIHNAKPY